MFFKTHSRTKKVTEFSFFLLWFKNIKNLKFKFNVLKIKI